MGDETYQLRTELKYCPTEAEAAVNVPPSFNVPVPFAKLLNIFSVVAAIEPEVVSFDPALIVRLFTEPEVNTELERVCSDVPAKTSVPDPPVLITPEVTAIDPLIVNALALVVNVPSVNVSMPEIDFELFKLTFVPEF
jgi:hypothetical protein